MSNIENKSDIVEIDAVRNQEHYENAFNKIIEKVGHIESFIGHVGINNINYENFTEFANQNFMGEISFINYSIAPLGFQEYYYSLENDDDIVGHD